MGDLNGKLWRCDVTQERGTSSTTAAAPYRAPGQLAALTDGAARTQLIARYGAGQIVNTDQGSQLSNAEVTAVVARIGARQSMDGKG